MNDIRQRIHSKVVDLARQLGRDARALGFQQEIPASGVLDSSALMELIMWFENEFGMEVDQDSLTIENFGTIDLMARYAEQPRQ